MGSVAEMVTLWPGSRTMTGPVPGGTVTCEPAGGGAADEVGGVELDGCVSAGSLACSLVRALVLGARGLLAGADVVGGGGALEELAGPLLSDGAGAADLAALQPASTTTPSAATAAPATRLRRPGRLL